MRFVRYLFIGVGIFSCLLTVGQTKEYKPKFKGIVKDSSAGHTVLINQIYILGNKKTKDEIITRELTFKKGDLVPINVVKGITEEDRNKIYNTNLFNTVDLQVLERDSTLVDIFIKVSERWYFYPVPIFKLGDRNINDWLFNRDGDLSRLNYGLKLYKFNFRGRNERLKLVGQFGFTVDLLAEYRIPYIEASQRHGLAFQVAFNERRSLPFRTIDHLPEFSGSEEITNTSYGGNVVYSFRNDFYTYHRLTAGFLNSTILESIAELNPNYLGDGKTQQRRFRLAYSFSQDYRDNRNYPLHGYSLLGSFEQVGLGAFDDVDIWRILGSYNRYDELPNQFYLSTGINGFISKEQDVPYFNYTAFGYGNYLVRGYELKLIEGYRNVLFKSVLRKPIFSAESNISKIMPLEQFQKVPLKVYAKLFFDSGWIDNYRNNEQSSLLSNKLLYGVGAGLDFVTLYDFVFRTEASYNAEGEFHFFINFKADL